MMVLWYAKVSFIRDDTNNNNSKTFIFLILYTQNFFDQIRDDEKISNNIAK
jgi:hypothetical protein